ncbi:MAG: hypothetical protein H7A23_01705 [Leptospiraceae bacterium]|nr:hypothetical protein [Leptospiraceae bacterium]
MKVILLNIIIFMFTSCGPADLFTDDKQVRKEDCNLALSITLSITLALELNRLNQPGYVEDINRKNDIIVLFLSCNPDLGKDASGYVGK